MIGRLRYMSRVLAYLAAASLSVASAGAQDGTSLDGVVTDSDGLPIFGAVVVLTATGQDARTDDRGAFRFSGVPAGAIVITARRLGYAPASVNVSVATGVMPERVRIVLSPLPALLDQVTVQRGRVGYTGRLAGYYQRLEQKGAGQFITRADIEVDERRTLSQLLADGRVRGGRHREARTGDLYGGIDKPPPVGVGGCQSAGRIGLCACHEGREGRPAVC